MLILNLSIVIKILENLYTSKFFSDLLYVCASEYIKNTE